MACERQQPVTALYNIDSLVDHQSQALAQLQAGLAKQVIFNGKAEEGEVQPKDSTGWNSELEIFKKMSVINKPVYRSKYISEEAVSDPSSNLIIKTYRAVEDAPVAYLKIYYQNSPSQLRRIEAKLDEENSMYRSSRTFRMDFTRLENQSILKSYLITGGQKMMFDDTVTYEVKGTIVIE